MHTACHLHTFTAHLDTPCTCPPTYLPLLPVLHHSPYPWDITAALHCRFSPHALHIFPSHLLALILADHAAPTCLHYCFRAASTSPPSFCLNCSDGSILTLPGTLAFWVHLPPSTMPGGLPNTLLWVPPRFCLWASHCNAAYGATLAAPPAYRYILTAPNTNSTLPFSLDARDFQDTHLPAAILLGLDHYSAIAHHLDYHHTRGLTPCLPVLTPSPPFTQLPSDAHPAALLRYLPHLQHCSCYRPSDAHAASTTRATCLPSSGVSGTHLTPRFLRTAGPARLLRDLERRACSQGPFSNTWPNCARHRRAWGGKAKAIALRGERCYTTPHLAPRLPRLTLPPLPCCTFHLLTHTPHHITTYHPPPHTPPHTTHTALHTTTRATRHCWLNAPPATPCTFAPTHSHTRYLSHRLPLLLYIRCRASAPTRHTPSPHAYPSMPACPSACAQQTSGRAMKGQWPPTGCLSHLGGTLSVRSGGACQTQNTLYAGAKRGSSGSRFSIYCAKKMPGGKRKKRGGVLSGEGGRRPLVPAVLPAVPMACHSSLLPHCTTLLRAFCSACLTHLACSCLGRTPATTSPTTLLPCYTCLCLPAHLLPSTLSAHTHLHLHCTPCTHHTLLPCTPSRTRHFLSCRAACHHLTPILPAYYTRTRTHTCLSPLHTAHLPASLHCTQACTLLHTHLPPSLTPCLYLFTACLLPGKTLACVANKREKGGAACTSSAYYRREHI